MVRETNQMTLEKRQFGKLGMKEQPLVGQILSPAETTRKRALAATANFHAIDREDMVLRKRIDTSHGNANNHRLGESGKSGEIFEKQTQGSIVVQVPRYAMPIGNVLRHKLGRVQEDTSQHHRRIHSCRIPSHQNVVQNTICCGS